MMNTNISLENLNFFRDSAIRGQLTFRGAYDRIRLSSTTEYRQWKPIGKRRKSTEGVKLSGAAAGGATVNGSTLWRHPLGGGRRCNVRIGSSRSAVTMNISWHRLLLVRISQATGRRRYWTDILKIIFLIPCIRLYMQRIWGFLFQFA